MDIEVVPFRRRQDLESATALWSVAIGVPIHTSIWLRPGESRRESGADAVSSGIFCQKSSRAHLSEPAHDLVCIRSTSIHESH